MKLMKLSLDVAFRDNAGVIDVVAAIEKAVNESSDDVLAAEVVFDTFDRGEAAAPAKRKKCKYVRRAKPAGPEAT